MGSLQWLSTQSRPDILFEVNQLQHTTNKRVIESSLAAETHAALLAHGLSRFVQALLVESRFGPEIVCALDDDDWQGLLPVNMMADCKSVYIRHR